MKTESSCTSGLFSQEYASVYVICFMTFFSLWSVDGLYCFWMWEEFRKMWANGCDRKQSNHARFAVTTHIIASFRYPHYTAIQQSE